MTLQEQMLALCDQHDLSYLAIAVYTLPDGTRFFGGSAHGGGLSGGDTVGTNGTPAEVIASAIAALNAKRFAAPVVAELEAA